MRINAPAVMLLLSLIAFGSCGWAIGPGPNYDPTKNMLFPNGERSKTLYTSLHNSGEFGVGPRVKKKKGALKRLRDIEVSIPGLQGVSRVSESGEGSLVKIRGTSRKETVNVIPSADGQMAQVFVRSKKGKVISNRATASLGPTAMWFPTFSRIRQTEASLRDRGRISPSYLSAAPGLFGANSDAYVSLDSDILADLQLLTLAQIKGAVISFAAYAQASGADLDIKGRSADDIRQFFDGFSTIAFGIVKSFQDLDPDTLETQIAALVSISREVIGLSEEGLAAIIDLVQRKGSINWSAVAETARELVDLPVKRLSEEFRFVVEYSWPPDQQDLDTGTTFLGNTVGFAHADSAPFMLWTGDDTTTGGVEVVDIDLFGAAQAGSLPSGFSVDCAAGWFAPAGGSGPATLHLYLLNARTGARFGEVTATISPGTQDGPATTPVGGGDFVYDDATGILRFSIR